MDPYNNIVIGVLIDMTDYKLNTQVRRASQLGIDVYQEPVLGLTRKGKILDQSPN